MVALAAADWIGEQMDGEICRPLRPRIGESDLRVHEAAVKLNEGLAMLRGGHWKPAFRAWVKQVSENNLRDMLRRGD